MSFRMLRAVWYWSVALRTTDIWIVSTGGPTTRSTSSFCAPALPPLPLFGGVRAAKLRLT